MYTTIRRFDELCHHCQDLFMNMLLPVSKSPKINGRKIEEREREIERNMDGRRKRKRAKSKKQFIIDQGWASEP